jgi:LacI family transcriptional regulator
LSRLTLKRVAIAFPAASVFLAEVLRGIAGYAREHGHWIFVGSPEPDSLNVSVENFRGWHGDGIIASVITPREARCARRLDAVVVNISGALEDAGLPRVRSDYAACGVLAAEHLLERGFTRFAMYGLQKIWFAQEMRRGFVERLRRDGFDCAVLEVPSILVSRRPWRPSGLELEDWLKTLRPPVGLFACSDTRARMVAEACERLGLRVPEDVAIAGINDDELVCKFCNPPLTSIARKGERVGWEAAAMLDRLMAGKPLHVQDVAVPPEGVVPRASTEVNVIPDPIVAAAARHIQELATQPVDINHIMAAVPRSRRWLEQRFRECLHMSPHAFLCRTRVQMAQKLLTNPGKPLLKQVALRCGFHDARRLRIVFERFVGLPPVEFRRRHLPGLKAPSP